MSDESEKETPEILWKYRSWGDHAKSMIVSSEVYFATLTELNDPLDSHWCERLPMNKRERLRFIKHLCAKTFPDDTALQRVDHLATLIQQVSDLTRDSPSGLIRTVAKADYGVLCLSEINYDFLMWSHYADHHKGICVGIRTDRMARKRFLPCRYCEDAPVIDAWDYIRISRGQFVDAAMSKAAHWSYENEWRTVDQPGAKRYPGCVDSIVLGVRIEEATRAAVLAAVTESEHPIKVFQAMLHRTKYQLVILPIEEVSAIAETYRRS
jgi:hypothetical protein